MSPDIYIYIYIPTYMDTDIDRFGGRTHRVRRDGECDMYDRDGAITAPGYYCHSHSPPALSPLSLPCCQKWPDKAARSTTQTHITTTQSTLMYCCGLPWHRPVGFGAPPRRKIVRLRACNPGRSS